MKRNNADVLLYEIILQREGIQFALFDANLVLKMASRSLGNFTGVESRLSDVFPELAGMEEAILASIEQGEEIVIPRINCRRDEQCYMDLRLTPFDGQVLVILKDITQTGAMEQSLTQQRNEMALLNRDLEKTHKMLGNMSGLDELTQLSNRNAAKYIFQHRLVHARKYQYPLSLIFLDMDNLKKINDQFGHESGDLALKHLAETMRAHVRSEDVVTRWGGDEFAILLVEEREGARRIANVLLSMLADRLCVLSNGAKRQIHISIGICHVGPHALKKASLEKILDAADRAMYLSKRSGGDRVSEVNLD